ncbi:TRAP transporter small permease [Anaerobium acetethylicum]|uniref:TRAP-type C4-dicarboxylate transport system, small permease component n=1 Tax=Anaerobium acetethylicum TaxID=1619234 RepID=A0A1D3TS08_9FIRM|nr:TRAP transporter small permease [Anaerobium acetethylicum]SCP96561.1 TRAP-type C4-dicarboxylate transport system, small permease component [Anaerobium acetethylicum]
MKAINKILETVLALMVILMVLGCFWQIFTRFILGNPSKYTEEFLRYVLIWLTMLGVPFAYGRDEHISIQFITRTFQMKNLLVTKIAIEVLVLALSVFVMIAGGWMVTMNAAGQISPAMQIPMQFYYACVPISGLLMAAYSIERFIKFSKEIKEVK